MDPDIKWVLHHRREIDESLSMNDLIDRLLYYMRPVSELIFLTPSEHQKLHTKNKKAWNKGIKTGPLSEEHKEKISNSCKGGNSTSWKKGDKPWNKGVPLSEEQKEKMSKSLKGRKAWNKGKQMPEEQKEKIRKSKKNISEETRKKMSESAKKRWITNRVCGMKTLV